MIDKKSRRVVIINNIQSDTIDQAIFILKSDKTDHMTFKTDADISNEAQTIINNYIRQVERAKVPENSKVKKQKMPGWVKFFLTAGVIAVIFFITFYSL